MNEQRLVSLLSSFLGPGTKKGTSHFYFKCPVCNHHNHRLAIQVIRDSEPDKDYPWQCFHCKDINKTGGKSIRSLLKKFKAPKQTAEEICKLLDIKVNINKEFDKVKSIKLPDEFIPLYGYKPTTIYEANLYDQILTYLIDDRGLTFFDIMKYNIGMCVNGNYGKMIVIPSYNEFNIINYFVTRTPHDESKFKYRNADFDKTQIIPFESTINWNEPVILVEGVFDMISVKRNCIPLLGKTISTTLMKKLLDETVDKIYVCLDNDAMKNALIHCERLVNFGKEVYLVKLNGKDPNEIGFEEVNTIIQHTYPLTYNDILKHRLEIL